MATNDDQPRERSSLLKAYYGLESVSSEREITAAAEPIKPPEADISHSNSTADVDFVSKDDIHDPVDINGKHFLCKKYVDKMLSECNITQLEEENKKLSQQVQVYC